MYDFSADTSKNIRHVYFFNILHPVDVNNSYGESMSIIKMKKILMMILVMTMMKIAK